MKLNSAQTERSTPATKGRGARGFSLVEVLVVISILSLIVLALMSVFSSTQRAFRASVTQTDVLQGGRAAMDLITSDLRLATTSDGYSTGTADPILQPYGYVNYGVNFFVTNNGPYYTPLLQSLPGTPMMRTNLLQWFFVLGRQNTQWTGTGYIVNTASTNYFYPLYRYYTTTNLSMNPAILFNDFMYEIDSGNAGFTNMSHVMDGVVHLVVRAYDLNGVMMTNGYAPAQMSAGFTNNILPHNTWFTAPYPFLGGGEVGMVMSSNALPATVELQMGILEDRAMQRAIAMGIPGVPAGPTTAAAQWNYLQTQSGHVHVFRERVTLENCDPAAYQ